MENVHSPWKRGDAGCRLQLFLLLHLKDNYVYDYFNYWRHILQLSFPSWKFQGNKQGWRYNRGQYSRWPLYIVYLKVHICTFLTLLMNTTHLMSLIYLYCSIEDSLNVNYILLKSFDCLYMHLNLFWIWYPLSTIHAIFRIFFWNWI